MPILFTIWAETFTVLFKDMKNKLRGDVLWRVYYLLSLLPF